MFCFQCKKFIIVLSFFETTRVTEYTVLLYACGENHNFTRVTGEYWIND